MHGHRRPGVTRAIVTALSVACTSAALDRPDAAAQTETLYFSVPLAYSEIIVPSDPTKQFYMGCTYANVTSTADVQVVIPTSTGGTAAATLRFRTATASLANPADVVFGCAATYKVPEETIQIALPQYPYRYFDGQQSGSTWDSLQVLIGECYYPNQCGAGPARPGTWFVFLNRRLIGGGLAPPYRTNTTKRSNYLGPPGARPLDCGPGIGPITPIPSLPYPTTQLQDAQILEGLPMGATPPSTFLQPPRVESQLDGATSAFQTLVAQLAKRRARPRRTSGYRPPAYQAHLYELKDLRAQLRRLLAADPTQRPACQPLIDAIAAEVLKHQLKEVAKRKNLSAFPADLKDLAVNRPGASAHETGNALDVGVSSINGSIVKRAAALSGVAQPYRGDDPVHFELLVSPRRRLRFDDVTDISGVVAADTAPLAATAAGRLEMLVTDPLGRRIGIDPATGLAINEIGPGASFAGQPGEGASIEIGDAVEGTYTLSGRGTQTGAFAVNVVEVAGDGTEISADLATGTVTAGIPVAPMPFALAPPAFDTTPPVVVAPAPITVLALDGAGSRVGALTALRTFVAAAQASDDRDPAPLLLEVVARSTPVTDDFVFPLGTTPVRFAYDDASGNIGSTESSVTVVPAPVGPGINLRVNGDLFAPGDRMEVAVEVRPGLTAQPVDVYAVVRLADGAYLSATPNGFRAGLHPYLQGVTPAGQTVALSYTFSGAEPPGGYAWLAGITAAGTGQLADDIEERPFTFTLVRGVPQPPLDLYVAGDGPNVELAWSPPASGPDPTAYVVEAGSQPGLSDLGTIAADASVTGLTVPGVPRGQYFVRVRSRVGTVVSGASNEVVVVVP